MRARLTIAIRDASRRDARDDERRTRGDDDDGVRARPARGRGTLRIADGPPETMRHRVPGEDAGLGAATQETKGRRARVAREGRRLGAVLAERERDGGGDVPGASGRTDRERDGGFVRHERARVLLLRDERRDEAGRAVVLALEAAIERETDIAEDCV